MFIKRERKAPEGVPGDLVFGRGSSCAAQCWSQVSWRFRFRLKGLQTSPSTFAWQKLDFCAEHREPTGENTQCKAIQKH